MKKLFALINKMRAKVSVNTNKHPILMTMLTLSAINIAVLLLAAGILMLINPSVYSSYIRAFLKAGEWLIFPSSMLSLSATGEIILGIIVALTGIVLFSGTIIAVTTNYLRSHINSKTEGQGKLPLSNHIVILNYNSQVLAILTDLMHDGRDETVIILSDKSKDFIKAELAGEIESLGEKPKSRLDLIVRKGDPFSVAELNDINITQAKSILVMDDECSKKGEENISAADFDAIKMVLILSKFNISPECPIAIEAESFKTAEIIRGLNKTVAGLKKKKLEVFSYHRKLGQFLALTTLCPPMSNVLSDFLSFAGSMFYPAEPQRIENYLEKCPSAIPVITTSKKTYMLSESESHLKQKREKPYKCARKVEIKSNINDDQPLKLYIIGENKKRQYLLEMLEAEDREIAINLYKSSERDKFIADLETAPKGESIALILSEDTQDNEIRDENVFLTLVEINQKFGVENRPFKIIAEILESKNQESIEQLNIQNIIVSSRIISFFATKLILEPNSDKFYEDVFTHSLKGSDSKFSLWVSDAKNLFESFENLKFHSYAELVNSIYYGSNKKLMPLGIIRNGKNILFNTALDKKRTFTIHETDSMIYVQYA